MREKLSRRELIRSAVAPALASCLRAQGRRPPNIVLIVADDLGYGDLGCYGNTQNHTPNLDRMAAEGVRFTDFCVSWPACTPSRGSILTGRYPQRNGLYDMIRNNEVNCRFQFDENTYALSPEMTLGLDLREVTVANVLKKAGYKTGIVGKWDSGRARRFLPPQRGFDFFYGFANTGIDYYTHERYGIASMFRGNQSIKEEGHATDLFRREALRFLEENRNGPFFLYLPFNAPHAASTFDKKARQAPEKYLAMYGGGLDWKTQYRALVTQLDDSVGEILKHLREYNLDEETLVLFMSDNGGGGGSTNAPLRGHKGTMWEGGLRVPLIARAPGRIPKGLVSNEFTTSMDLLPTFARLAGADLPRGVKLDGFDIMPIMRGKARSSRTEFFSHRPFNNSSAARVGKWKWAFQGEKEELFDLSRDLSEKQDLSKERPDILAMVKARYAAWWKAMEDSEPRGPFRDY